MESLMRFLTDVKLFWECVERAYRIMCGISSQPDEHRLKTKCNDIEDVNLEYRKQTSYQTDSHRQGDQTAELGAKYNNILTDEISFIEKLSFNGFNEGTDQSIAYH